jgi:alanyl-tRNA synthetase
MSAREIIDIYISFFEKRGHKQIANSPLVPENDPTTLFTSSGMQPLIPYLLGEPHPSGKKLVNVQNCFRAVDIEEVGDNRHETFFRMLGNWSLGDYFKNEEIPWLWELLTKEFGLPEEKLYITIFEGTGNVPYDQEAFAIWSEVLKNEGMNPKERIFAAGVDKNWWSRSGIPENMPVGEIGGPDSEVYFKFDESEHKKECKNNPVDCECGKFLEIANSVFMQYQKTEDGFKELPQKNVDYGGGVERLLAAVENTPDVFQTSLFSPIIKAIEKETGKNYNENKKEMQIIADHLAASVFIASNNVTPSKNQQGYILRRLIRRAIDNFREMKGANLDGVLEKIIEEYSKTDAVLKEKYEEIKNIILEEQQAYSKTIEKAEKIITVQKTISGKANIVKEISAEEAFKMYATHGLSPTQVRSLGYVFNEQQFADLMEKHKSLSRTASSGMFKGGLADTSEKTIMGHTATHLLHKALRNMLGEQLHQTGSNITSERVRFDFNFDRKLEDSEIAELEKIVNGKIAENLPVHYEIMPLAKAKEIGAIGLFDEKYQKDVKVYFVGDYSKELCGGPHVDFTSKIKKFRIIKQENIGHGQRRLYAVVG